MELTVLQGPHCGRDDRAGSFPLDSVHGINLAHGVRCDLEGQLAVLFELVALDMRQRILGPVTRKL